MNIDITELTALIAATSNKPSVPQNQQAHPFTIGANYFIRTVTHHYTGRLVEVYDAEIVLESCCWIADDGRFSQAVQTGTFSEVEPFGDGRVIVGRGSILDAKEISFALPASQK